MYYISQYSVLFSCIIRSTHYKKDVIDKVKIVKIFIATFLNFFRNADIHGSLFLLTLLSFEFKNACVQHPWLFFVHKSYFINFLKVAEHLKNNVLN
jgi:hypothetical protein